MVRAWSANGAGRLDRTGPS